MISVHSLEAIRGIAANKSFFTFATLDLKIAITDSTLTYKIQKTLFITVFKWVSLISLLVPLLDLIILFVSPPSSKNTANNYEKYLCVCREHCCIYTIALDGNFDIQRKRFMHQCALQTHRFSWLFHCCIHLPIHHMSRIPVFIFSFSDFVIFVVRTIVIIP